MLVSGWKIRAKGDAGPAVGPEKGSQSPVVDAVHTLRPAGPAGGPANSEVTLSPSHWHGESAWLLTDSAA